MASTRLSHKVWLALAAILCALFLLEAGLRLAGWIFLSAQKKDNRYAQSLTSQYKIMCVGESTTALGGVDSYPAQLGRILNEKYPGRYVVFNDGMPGVTTSWIVSHIGKELDEYRPDIVVVMMGINDVTPPLDRVRIPRWIKEPFKSLRVYKLCELSWERIKEKVKESRIPRTARHEELARKYKVQGMYDKAEQEYAKARELEPYNTGLIAGLAWIYNDQGKFHEAEGLFIKAIALAPKEGWLYVELARLYRSRGMLECAERSFRDALKCGPRQEEACLELARLYCDQGKYVLAENVLKAGSKADPGSSRIYGALAGVYQATGKSAESQEYFRKEFTAMRLRKAEYSAVTSANFRALKAILDARGIRMVCAQYPLRPVAELERIFDGDTGVTFVENRKEFKGAILASSYEEYFWDRFAGDFGHCTAKGNKLLAENIAKAITGK